MVIWLAVWTATRIRGKMLAQVDHFEGESSSSMLLFGRRG
jgi:hypothetical protein